MSDVVGSALVDIQPDFTGFERELTAGLQQAADKAARQVQFNFNAKSAEASTAGLNSALQAVNQSVQNLTKSINNLNNSYANISSRQRQFQDRQQGITRGTQQQSSAFSGFVVKAAIVANSLVQMGSTIATLTTRFKGFNDIQQSITKTFTGFGKSTGAATGSASRFSGVVSRLGSVFRPVGQQASRATKSLGNFFSEVPKTETIRTEIFGIGGAFEGVQEKTIEFGNGIKTVLTETTDASGVMAKGFIETSGKARGAFSNITAGGKETAGAVQTVKKASTNMFGPGTTSLNEFAAKKPLLARFTLFAQQSFQNIRFHILRAFRAPLKAIKGFGAVIGNVFRGLRSGVSAFGSIGNSVSSVVNKFHSLGERMSALKSKGGPLNQVLGSLGNRLKTLGPLGIAGLAAAGLGLVATAATKAIFGLSQKASSLQESINAVNVTLGDAAPKFKELIGDTSSLGITQLELNESLTPIIPLLKDAGKSGEGLAVDLEQLSRRAVDLGSIFNKTSAEVLTKLGSAIRGEIEPARALGVTFNAAAVEAEAAALGFAKVDGQLSEQSKTLARFNLVLSKTEFAAGDFQRTSEGLENATKSFRAVIAELSFAFSDVFLPAAEKIRASLNKLVSEMGPEVKRFFPLFQDIMTEIGEVIADIGVTALHEALRGLFDVLRLIMPVFEAFVFAIRNMFQIFEVFTVVLGNIVPGLSLTSIWITRLAANFAALKIIGTVTFLVKGLSGALSILGARSAAAGLASFSRVLSAAAGPLGVLITLAVIAIPLFQRFSNNTIKPLTERLEDFKDSANGGAEALEKLLTASQLTALESTTEDIAAMEERVDSLNEATGRGSDLARQQLALRQQEVGTTKDLKDAEEAFFEAGKAGLIVQARAAIATIKNAESRERLTLELERGVRAREAEALAAEQNRAILEGEGSAIQQLINKRKEFNDSLSSAVSAQSALKSAQAGVRSAEEGVARATERLNELIVQRNTLLADTVRDTEELVAAQRDLRLSEKALNDLREEQADFSDDLSQLQDRRTRAEIALARALRVQKKAQEELNEETAEEERLSVDLAGLTVDQIRTRLASARAALAAQKASQKTATAEKEQTEEKKTQEELEEEALEAEINLRDLRRSIEEIDEQIENRKEKQKELTFDIADAERGREKSAKALEAIQRGETTRSRELLGINQQITAAEEARRTAVEAVAAASERVEEAIFNSKLTKAELIGDEETILGLMKQQTGELLAQTGLADGLIAKVSEAAGFIDRAFDPTVIQQFLDATGALPTAAVVGLGAVFGSTADALQTAAAALGFAAEGTRVSERNIEELARVTGTRIAAVAEGGVFSRPTRALIGEAGREAVLPLTRPARMVDLLSNPKVLPPVLSALGKVAFTPRLQAAVSTSPGLSTGFVAGGGGKSESGLQDQRKDLLLQEIKALREDLKNMSSSINVNLNQDIRNDDPVIAGRRAAREVEKRLRKLSL